MIYPRRRFIQQLSYAAMALPSAAFFSAHTASAYHRSPGIAAAEPAAGMQSGARPLGIALVGLGNYSENQLAPALQETTKCKLTGIVTGTPEKARKWADKYKIPGKNIYSYENFDTIKDNADIDIVYVVLPNAMHAEYVIRAARAGKHVICEKPMAVSVRQCQDMIDACNKAGKLLSIGYRLHFEPYNLTMAEYGKRKTLGAIKKVIAEDGQMIDPGVWRLDKELAGGGPLMDVGIYCVQGVLYTTGEMPIAVTAQEGKKTDPKKFKEVEESLTWQMEFPGGIIAECKTSYSKELNLLRAEADKGWIQLEPAYEYKGIKGQSSQGTIDLPQVNQQARQMDDFANCVLTNTKSKVPGEMGLRDVKIIMSIYEAAKTGKKVALSA